jgi:hypothetical protein
LALGNDVAKELDFASEELTLRKLRVELIATKDFEDSSKICRVLLYGGRIDEDIVQEDYDALVQEGPEDAIHKSHKRGGCICETKGHDCKLKLSQRRIESCFILVAVCNPNLMIPGAKIYFREIPCPL